MSHTTQGTLLLDKIGIVYSLHPYTYDPDAPRIGLHAAESLGLEPSQVFKTLMAEVDDGVGGGGQGAPSLRPSPTSGRGKLVGGEFEVLR